MKKMIGVINDNLRSVVNGIKEHRESTENNLSVVKNEIDEKVVTASKYKDDVETARKTIISLETEISELENDLKELNEKFGSKNFKEILAAGDKEINTKITEKRASISEQNSIIGDITKKAHQLKKELTKLKDKKQTIEEDLNKTIILEGYYNKRINAIIDFSVEHPEELATYKEIEEVEDLSTEEIEDIDINNIIDGQVFNEIDSISSGKEVELDAIDEVLTHDDSLEEEEETDDTEDTEDSGEDLNKLDDIINTANELIENNESEIEEPASKENNHFIEIEDLTEVEINEPIDIEINEPIEEEKKEHIHLHQMSEPITVNLDNLDDGFKPSIDTEIVFSNDNGFNDSNLIKCGLVKENFDPKDLDLLKPKFDRENTLEFIEVLKKHGFDETKIYNSVGVLLDVTPQNLDKMLTMLEGVASNEDIDCVFRYLDKVNIGKLEQNIQTSNDSSLTELLVTALNEEKEADLANLLSITDKDVNYIKKNNSEDYKLMVNFPEVILSNYNILKDYKINNLTDCIVKHPHRFTFNPSKFAAILDKYDVEDLVRCINKNAAVIDKL